VGDSLSDGKSKFLAEVERLQQTVRSTAESLSVAISTLSRSVYGTVSGD
jgi:hypothetical protein